MTSYYYYFIGFFGCWTILCTIIAAAMPLNYYYSVPRRQIWNWRDNISGAKTRRLLQQNHQQLYNKVNKLEKRIIHSNLNNNGNGSQQQQQQEFVDWMGRMEAAILESQSRQAQLEQRIDMYFQRIEMKMDAVLQQQQQQNGQLQQPNPTGGGGGVGGGNGNNNSIQLLLGQHLADQQKALDTLSQTFQSTIAGLGNDIQAMETNLKTDLDAQRESMLDEILGPKNGASRISVSELFDDLSFYLQTKLGENGEDVGNPLIPPNHSKPPALDAIYLLLEEKFGATGANFKGPSSGKDATLVEYLQTKFGQIGKTVPQKSVFT